MTKFFSIAIVALFIFATNSYAESCLDYGSTQAGEYLFANNAYHRGKDDTGKQCINQQGWSWDWDNEGYIPHAYPSIIYGKNPFREQSTTKKLPRTISNVHELTAKYDFNTEGNCWFNGAFDMWFTEAGKPATEIMVWSYHHIMTPAGHYRDTVKIDGVDYEVWQGKVQTWNYIAYWKTKSVFVNMPNHNEGTLNLKSFINDSINRGYLDTSNHLSSVEFGNEILCGKGHTEINNYSIDIR